ncbi:hypothetical protein LCGC14_2397440 [marine sediment metagenome]|uniref:Uncharacterized protein n=1 Tax=marine sediment metagenome TaxID=412755 RepID=A0A0F9EQU7_9ZZZZ
MDGDTLDAMLRSEGMKLILPLPPNRANAREHWRVTHRKKQEYYDMAAFALLGKDWTSGMRGNRVRLSATLFLWVKMDRDNLVARLKWPIDCLVRHDLLVDDNEKWLDLQMPKQAVDRKNMRVEIELTPCASLDR